MRIKPLRLTNYLLVYFVSKPRQFIPFRTTCFFDRIVLHVYRQREKSQRGQNHQLVNFESHFSNPNSIQTLCIIHQIAPNLFLFSYFCHSRPRGRAPFGEHQESRPLAMSNTACPRFTDLSSLCACSESSLANLIGSGINLLCLQIHSKPECRWTGPEVAILGADQKERSL